MTGAIVNIQKLAKTYPGKVPVEAVKGIDLAVQSGELFGLLGPNGAGKSTTISVCTTRSLPTAGRVSIAGIDVVQHPAEARRYMSVVTQFNTLDRQCTVWENLYFHCRYFGIPHAESAKRADELIELFQLTEKSKTFVKTLSGGLAQRVQIARAAHNPEVLFLDEPSADHGKILVSGTPEELKSSVGAQRVFQVQLQKWRRVRRVDRPPPCSGW